MAGTTRQKDPATIVNEELRRIKVQNRQPGPPARPPWRRLLGIVEIAAGVTVIAFSFAAGIMLSLLLGAAVLAGGILEVAAGLLQRSVGHIVIGALGAVAGILILANPLASLAVVSLAVGLYLAISGAMSAYRGRGSAGGATGGIIEMLLGLIVLFGGSGVGFLAGIYLIVRGIMTYKTRPAPPSPLLL
jgi:uncharacterized membrane protein HdeD (DUF308 family)